jgi:hypothetical protein
MFSPVCGSAQVPETHGYNPSYSEDREIRSMEVQSQPRQIVCKTLPQKYPTQKGLVEWLK